MTASKAAKRIFGKISYATRKAVHRLFASGEFPGAYKLSDHANAPIVIPEADVTAYIQKKRDQARAARPR